MQKLEDITDKLSRIESAWRNCVSDKVEQELAYLKERIDDKSHFDETLIEELLAKNFSIYLSIFRLFLEYSKDEFEGFLRDALPDGIGIKPYKHDCDPFVKALVNLGLKEAVEKHVAKRWGWTDVIIERLNDLRKIVKFQNDGYIQKIYTLSMIDELKDDLRVLKKEFGL